LEGRIELLRYSKLRSRFWRVYRNKFPFVTALFDANESFTGVHLKLAGIQPYRLKPDRVWYIDNRLGFGHRQCLYLAPTGIFEL
jgi:hypothetical protein